MWSGFWTERFLLLTSGRAVLRERVLPITRSCRTLYDGDEASLRDIDLPRARLGRPSLTVFFGPSACRFIVIDRPVGIVKEADARALLVAYAARSLGLVIDDWRFRVDNRFRRQLLACAFPADRVESISRWAAATRQRVAGVQPLYPNSVAGYETGVVITEDDGVFAAARTGDGRFRLVSMRASNADLPLVTHRLSASGGAGGTLHRLRLEPEPRGRSEPTFSDLLRSA